MNTRLIILFSALLSIGFLSCKKKNDPDLSKAFIKYFGGIEKDDAVDMELTGDGGFVIVGTTRTQGAGGSDILVIKANSQGNEEWRKTFGGVFDDYAGGIALTDGGYIVVGTQSYKGNVFDPKQDSTKMLAIRMDNGGNVVWDSAYQYQGFRLPSSFKIGGRGVDVARTLDGGYIFLGTMDSLYSYDVYAVKVDAFGNRTHTEDMIFGSDNYDDFPSKIVAAPDGDFVYSNSTTISGLKTFTAARFRPVGISLNSTVTNRDNESFNDTSMALGGDIIGIGGDNYALVGTTYSYVGGIGSPQDIFFTKLDNTLSPIGGVVTKFGSSSTKEQGQSVCQTNDGGFIILGTTDDESLIGAPEKKNDLFIVKISSSGAEEWKKTYGGIGDDMPLVIKQTPDNGYVVCATIDFGNNNDGSGKSNVIALIKLNESGELDNR